MLLRFVLLSLALFNSCSAGPAANFATHQIMDVVESSVRSGNLEPILFLLDADFNYSMCGYVGNKATFQGYMNSQMSSLVDIQFLTDFDNASIEEKDGKEYLTFHVDTKAIYMDRTRVEGGATVTAAKKQYGAMFYISNIVQRCRNTVKRHHRLYRLFTNENLYDYRKK
ncbi:unnamed protein product [Caenorhabditis sp. 36 PRJEB53466]|nr:unnamed protein product [Caenorhabditis sp. 36 PRJEB53466]